MTDDRKAIHAYVTDIAKDAWEEFAACQGVSVTGLIEALGQELAEEDPESDDRRPWVKAARRIDVERRKRKYAQTTSIRGRRQR